MTVYLNVETNEYPRHDGDLELLGWKVGDPLPENWVEVSIDPIPEVDENQTYQLQEPQLIDGQWRATWSVRAITDEERTIIESNKQAIEMQTKTDVFGKR